METWNPLEDGVPSNSLAPCERFTLMLGPDGPLDEYDRACVVCGHLEITHENPGKRALPNEEVERLRLSLIESSAS